MRVRVCFVFFAVCIVGRWNIRRLKGQADLKKLVGSDPFHTLVNQTTFKIILGIMGMVSLSVDVLVVVRSSVVRVG